MSTNTHHRSSVELIPAFSWTCPDCGTDHFARAVVPEMTDEDRVNVLESLGVEPWKEGELLANPLTVTCPDCGVHFPTVPFDSEQVG